MRLQSSFLLLLGSILVSSLCFANAQEQPVQEAARPGLEFHKNRVLNAIEEHLRIVRSDISLEDIKASMRLRLEETRNEFKKDFPELEWDQKFEEAFAKIDTIESKDQLVLEASNTIDSLNSAKVFVFGLTWQSLRILHNEGGVAYLALPLCIVPFALDVAFIWVEVPAQIVLGR